MKDIAFAKTFAQEFVQQLLEFGGQLPDDMQAGVVIGERIILVDFVDFLPAVGLTLLQGRSKTVAPQQFGDVLVRVFLSPELPYPQLLAVPIEAREPRGKVRIGFQVQESPPT